MRQLDRLYPAVLVLLAAPAFAAEPPNPKWGLCPLQMTQAAPSPADGARAAADAPTVLNSDYGEGRLNGLYTLRGGVTIDRGPQHMEADRAVYDSATGAVDAQGGILFRQGGMITRGESAKVNVRSGTGVIDNADYQYLQQHAHGHAATVVHENADITQLNHATYSTCDPGREDWELRAQRVKLDHAEAVGEAYNVTLRLKDVPVFYFPYINFPLNDQRKTGVLPPIIGYSNDDGFELGVPVYLNLAPNYDATITPRLISRRGLLTKGEFRYLTERSRGNVQGEVLPDDRAYGDNRGSFELLDATRLSSHWSSNLVANYVSDDQYLADLGSSLSTASTTELERRLDLNYNGDNTRFLARVQGYQNLDPTLPPAARPYQRIPQLLFRAAAPTATEGGDYQFDGEYVRFEKESSLTGTRLDITPALGWRMETQSYFFIPRVGLNHTQYQLDGQAAGQPVDPDRTTPIYSLDSGVFLERDEALGSHRLIQTLEPRLYYLRIPYRNQSDLPLFDTAAYDFSFAQLFRENRFTGADRLGDADQLSIALTSRLIDLGSGREWLSGSIGQIIYFANRRVVLSGPPDTRDRSDIVAEASSHFSDHWTAITDLQWDPDLDQPDEGSLQLHYYPDERHLINAGYRYRRPGTAQLNQGITQTDLSFLWLLTPRWQLLGRWNYSPRDHRTLEALAGVQYESCCWILRVINRRYVSDLSGGSSRSLYLQLELKGLGAIGNSARDVLENGILGYRPGI